MTKKMKNEAKDAKDDDNVSRTSVDEEQGPSECDPEIPSSPPTVTEVSETSVVAKKEFRLQSPIPEDPNEDRTSICPSPIPTVSTPTPIPTPEPLKSVSPIPSPKSSSDSEKSTDLTVQSQTVDKPSSSPTPSSTTTTTGGNKKKVGAWL